MKIIPSNGQCRETLKPTKTQKILDLKTKYYPSVRPKREFVYEVLSFPGGFFQDNEH